MGDSMKKENSYGNGYTESNNTIDYIKHGLMNEYGLNLDRCQKFYKEEDIIKKKCNIKRNSGK